MSKTKIELNSSRIKFENLLDLVDRAIDTGNEIQIPKNLISQNNNTMKLIRWLEGHKIISISSIEKKLPKKVSIRSRKRKIEISFLLYALNMPMKDIAKKFGVTLNTAKGYLKELDNYTDNYLKWLSIALKTKGITPEMGITNFPSFPIRISLDSFNEELTQGDFGQLMDSLVKNKFIKKVTGQSLGTFDLSFLLPKK